MTNENLERITRVVDSLEDYHKKHHSKDLTYRDTVTMSISAIQGTIKVLDRKDFDDCKSEYNKLLFRLDKLKEAID